MSGQICDNAPYGQHIVLKCVNHPEKKWSTKNIGGIGDRSIFYKNGWGEHKDMGVDCNCPLSKLVHDCADDKCRAGCVAR